MEQSQKYQDVQNIYLQKSYFKTASLMARGAHLAVILRDCIQGKIWREIAYAYDRNLDITFQVSCCSSFGMMYICNFFSL